MLQFLSNPCQYIKSRFVRNPSSPSPSPSPKPAEFSNLEYENLFMELLDKVEKGNSWGELQDFLIVKKLDKQRLASWLRSFGEGWLEQPETHQELARRLGLLGRVATGELAEVAKSLSEKLSCVGEEENQNINQSSNHPIRAEPESNEQGIELLLNQINQQLQSQDYEGALDSSVTATQRYSHDFIGWVYLGVILNNFFQNYSEALASFEQALKLQPDSYEAWVNRGNAMFNLGRYEEVLASFEQALKLQPDSYEACYKRGNALGNLGRNEEALASYDQALKLQPDDHLAWVKRGLVLTYLGRKEEALASYDQALKLQPDYYQAWGNRGLVLTYLGRNEEALASYDQVLKIQPDSYQAWGNRGILVGALSTYKSYGQQEFVKGFYLNISQVSQQLIPTLENTDLDRNLNHFQKSLSESQALLLKTFANSDAPKLIAQIKQPPPEKLSQLIQQPLPPELINLIQQPLSEEVRAKLEQDCLSHPPRKNPQLNLRGYEGQLASYQAELDKAICRDTDGLGWGKLHHHIGSAHYKQGNINYYSSHQSGEEQRRFFPPNSPQTEKLTVSQYLKKAHQSYRQALLTLTKDDYPEEHLEVLQDLIKVHLALGQTEKAEQLRIQGFDILRSLLNSKQSFTLKKQLTLKFISFYQLEVDILVKKGAFVQALSKAELSKNICLINILSTWQENVISPSYEQIQQLLTPGTAIICWHISPQALTTFVLKANATEPIIILKDDSISNPKQVSQSLLSLQEFTTWLKQWNQQYQDYRSKTKEQKERDRANHLWRKGMIARLEQLKTILNIDKIKSHLSDITRLILIPHQDLHRLPLHSLFEPSLTQITENKSLTINYFPSVQIALILQQRQPNHEQLSLLSVENPANDLPYAEIESTIINQMFTNSTSIGTETATNPAVKTALQQSHHIFHFTGHGAYNQRQPETSFLSLRGEHQLTAQEISNLNLKSYQLISLSACETGITGNQTIDTEYVGLVSAFLQAEATSVLHTLWTVEEISSAWLMIRFYQLFLDGIAPASALQQAQQWLRTCTYAQLIPWIDDLATTISDSHPNVGEYLQTITWNIQQDSDKMNSSSPLYDHPYYWAAFTLTGGNIR